MLAGAFALVGTLGAAAPATELKVKRASVAPEHAYLAGRKPATLRYLFRSGGQRRPVAVRVVRIGSGQVVARWRRPAQAPGVTHERRWPGLRRSGEPAPDGLYAFRISSPGAGRFPGGRFRLHGHRFPVKGAHGDRGPIGDFGAPRSGGRIHEGFDVTAPCGTPLLALRAGRVKRAGFDPQLYGNFVQVNAKQSPLTYFYAHLRRPAGLRAGDEIATSERLGKVGLTGNATGTPCHLHVELRRSGRLLDPEPKLRRWDRYG